MEKNLILGMFVLFIFASQAGGTEIGVYHSDCTDETIVLLDSLQLTTITLNNGRTITGRIVSEEGDEIMVETESGVLTIPKSFVKSTEKGAPSSKAQDVIVLKGGSIIKGTIVKYEPLTVQTADSSVITLNMNEVVSITKGGAKPAKTQSEPLRESKVTFGKMSDSRQGFLIGLGIGVGSTKVTTKFAGHPPFYPASEASESYTGFITDFKIGHAPSDYVAIFWTAKVSWLLDTTPLLISGIGNIAGAYYFQPESPSPFVSAGLGYSSYGAIFDQNVGPAKYGFGFFAGGGYEFAKHWSVEGHLVFGSPGSSNDTYSFGTMTFLLTINVLSY